MLITSCRNEDAKKKPPKKLKIKIRAKSLFYNWLWAVLVDITG